MKGYKPMLTSKLHVKYFCSLLMDFHKTSVQNSFDERIEMRDNNPMLTSKLYVLLNISAPC